MQLFTNKGRKSSVKLIDAEIERLATEAKTPDEIATVMRLMEQRQELRKSKPVDWNTVLTVAGSLGGIVLLVSYEMWAPITSKAFGFILRGRV